MKGKNEGTTHPGGSSSMPGEGTGMEVAQAIAATVEEVEASRWYIKGTWAAEDAIVRSLTTHGGVVTKNEGMWVRIGPPTRNDRRRNVVA